MKLPRVRSVLFILLMIATIVFLLGKPSAPYALHACAVYDSSLERFVVFGGVRGYEIRQVIGETWIYDNEWKMLKSAMGPSARRGSSLCSMDKEGIVVLYGGESGYGQHYGDTWVLQSNEWRVVEVEGPSPRVDAAMCYDDNSGRAFLFGGCGPVDGERIVLADTWYFDGLKWQRVATNGVTPPARYSAAMAYDSHRNVMVLMGGTPSVGLPLTDLWEWDGQEWRTVELSAESPFSSDPWLDRESLFYDRERRQLLAIVEERERHQLWQWDGRVWVLLHDAVLFEERITGHVTSAWDSNNRRLLFFVTRFGMIDYLVLRGRVEPMFVPLSSLMNEGH